MFICEKCEKEFKTKWHLQRHYGNKIPCYKNTQKPIRNTQKPISNTQKPIINFNCKYCNKECSRKFNLDKHLLTCKEKDDIVRGLELMLNIGYPLVIPNECRFCNNMYLEKYTLTKHLKLCKEKEIYRSNLEQQVKNRNTAENVYNTIHNTNTINVLNVSAAALKSFGQESTEHITNEFLRKLISRLEVPLPKVVSTVAKQIYCNNNVPENRTLKITNLRSQWAKVSNGNCYDQIAISESVNGVRNKVTDLYIARQSDEPDYFDRVSKRIEMLDDINNQNFTPRSVIEKEEQKGALKLKSEIEKEVKSCLYNSQKTGLHLSI